MAKAQIGCLIEALEPRALLAATYYVATTGNNASAGSSGAPWRTLQYAADHVAAGDTVIVQPGNYVGFNLETSGTPSARITFKAQKGAVINAVNGVTKDGINLENASYVTIDGFTLSGTNDPATSRAGIRAVGDGFDTGVFSKGVIIQNNTVIRARPRVNRAVNRPATAAPVCSGAGPGSGSMPSRAAHRRASASRPAARRWARDSGR